MSTIRNNQTIMTDELTLFVKTTYYQQASMTFSVSLKNN